MQELGIPGQVSIRLSTLASDAVRPGQLLRVAGNGRACGCPPDLLDRIYSVARRQVLTPAPKLREIGAWLQELLSGASGPGPASEFLAAACTEAVKRRPLILFGPQQRIAYFDRPGKPRGREFTPEQIATIEKSLEIVLDLGMPIGRHDAVLEIAGSGLDKGTRPEDIAEGLISELISDSVAILMPRDYLRQLTTADAGDGHDKFPQVREDLFYELGLRYPEFHFVPSDDLPPGFFAFAINQVATLPWVGPAADQYLANSSLRTLRGRNIEAVAVLNPVSGGEWSLVEGARRPELEQAGIPVRNAMGYVALCLGAELRRHSAAFVHRQLVTEQLTGLEQVVPDLIRAARGKFSLEQIARVLRGLVAEDVSMRNLRLILQSMIDCDYVVTDPGKYIVIDDRLPVSGEPPPGWDQEAGNLVSQVRSGMRRYLSHKFTRGRNTLIVNLVAPEIENLLAQREPGAALSEGQQLKLLKAVAAKYRNQPAETPLPAILTTIEVRPALRALLAADFPPVPVMAYQELAPEVTVQPIFRISLE
jgi:hypothetical protein